jgi:hypothetical protein
MGNFNDFSESLKDGIKDLAEDTLKDHADAAINDSKDFLEKTKDDLKRWTEQLARGELSQSDLKFLLEGKKDLAEMYALQQAGMALVKVDKFRKSLCDLVVEKAVDVFL